MTHYQLLGKILKDVREDMSDDELTELLLENKISVSDNKKITFGQRASDKLAEFAGSWFFIIAFTLFLLIWVLINVYFLKPVVIMCQMDLQEVVNMVHIMTTV